MDKKGEQGFEDKILFAVTERLQRIIENNRKLRKFALKSKVNILKDITVMPHPDIIKKGKKKVPPFCLVFGDAEQDLVLFHKNYKIEVPFDSINVKKAQRSFISSTKNGRNHFPYIIIPMVIFEFKYGHVNTHAITNYSSIAQQIKDKYPDVIYNLILINCTKMPETLFRHGKNFNKMISIKANDFNTIVEKVSSIVEREIRFSIER